jgi:hypothetical protein
VRNIRAKVPSPRSTVAVVVAEPETREVAAYGRFVGAPSRAQLERFFFLGDADSRLVAMCWGDRNRVGFAFAVGHRAVARHVWRPTRPMCPARSAFRSPSR